MNRRKVLLAMVMAPFAGLMGKVTPKPIKTEADLTEAIDRGMAQGFAGHYVKPAAEFTYTGAPGQYVVIEAKIAGYNNPDSDIVSLRFNGDGR